MAQAGKPPVMYTLHIMALQRFSRNVNADARITQEERTLFNEAVTTMTKIMSDAHTRKMKLAG